MKIVIIVTFTYCLALQEFESFSTSAVRLSGSTSGALNASPFDGGLIGVIDGD